MGNLRPRLRDPQRTETPADQYHERIDEDTGEIWLCKGDALSESEDTIQPIIQLTARTMLVGQDGDIQAVDADGRASVSVDNQPRHNAGGYIIADTAWELVIDNGVNTTGFSGSTIQPEETFDALMANTLSGGFIANSGEFPAAMFVFIGTDTAEDTINWRASRVYKVTARGSTSYTAIPAGTGLATLGDVDAILGAGGDAFGGAGNDAFFFADTITESNQVVGVSVFPNASQCMAMMSIDFMGSLGLIMEIDLLLAQRADVLGAPCGRHYAAGFNT